MQINKYTLTPIQMVAIDNLYNLYRKGLVSEINIVVEGDIQISGLF